MLPTRLPVSRLPALAVLVTSAAFGSWAAHAQQASATASVTVSPYWSVGPTAETGYLEPATRLETGAGRASTTLNPTSLTPPAPNWHRVAEGSGTARADALSGSLGVGATTAYDADLGVTSASAVASLDSGPATWSGGRTVSLSGLPYQYLGQLRLTMHGSLDGLANGTLTVGGFNIASGLLSVRTDIYRSATVGCEFAGNARRCSPLASADLSGDRAFTTATWSGTEGPSFNLFMTMPVLANPFRDDFRLQLSLAGTATSSLGELAGARIDMLNTSTLQFLPAEGVTVRFADPLFLSSPVDEPASAWLALAGLAVVARALARQRAATRI